MCVPRGISSKAPWCYHCFLSYQSKVSHGLVINKTFKQLSIKLSIIVWTMNNLSQLFLNVISPECNFEFFFRIRIHITNSRMHLEYCLSEYMLQNLDTNNATHPPVDSPGTAHTHVTFPSVLLNTDIVIEPESLSLEHAPKSIQL